MPVPYLRPIRPSPFSSSSVQVGANRGVRIGRTLPPDPHSRRKRSVFPSDSSVVST